MATAKANAAPAGPHNYVITSANTVDDLTTITGSVDGIPVTIQCWHSALATAQAASVATLKTLVAGLMLNAAYPNVPTADSVVSPISFTQ